MKTTLQLFVTGCLLMANFEFLSAQQLNHENDHVLNYKGQSRITIATGIPYIAIGEYAYGFSDRITVGALWGLTPNVEGYGIRARAVVYQANDDFRVYFCTPILFYPKTKELGGDSWWLMRPNINIEWIQPSGFRYKIGGSIIAAASHHSLFGNPADAKFGPGVWNSVHGGLSFPVGEGLMAQGEASLVMNGLRVAGSDWVGGPPVILTTGISYTF